MNDYIHGKLSVLIVRGAFAEMYEPAWNRALRELGVASEVFDAHLLTLPGILGRAERRILCGPGIRRIHRRIVARVRTARPNITLIYQGHYFDAETVAELARWSLVTGYHNDDPFGSRNRMLRYRHLLPALPLYHGFHVYRQVNVSEALMRGARRVGLLQSYYLPWLDHQRWLTVEEKRQFGCDLVFAGHAEPDMRVSCLSRAVRKGIHVKLYGEDKYWKSALEPEIYRSLGPISKIVGDSYRMALCGAKIAACFLSKWNRDQYTRRVFEIPACGVFLLAERTPTMQALYEEGKEAEFFASSEEFVQKALFYAEHDDARQRIANAGRQRALTSGYDIHSRMKQWLADVLHWREELKFSGELAEVKP